MAEPTKNSAFTSADPFAANIPNSNGVSEIHADPISIAQNDVNMSGKGSGAVSHLNHGAHVPAAMDSLSNAPSTSLRVPNALSPAPGSPTPESDNSKLIDKSVLDKINAGIAKRTAETDAATKKKEMEILAAAKAYVQKQQQQHEQSVKTAQEANMKTQQADKEQIEKYNKSDEVWSAVGMAVDITKPNPYSQNTESMRALLTKLQSNPPLPSPSSRGHAMVATAAVSLSK